MRVDNGKNRRVFGEIAMNVKRDKKSEKHKRKREAAAKRQSEREAVEREKARKKATRLDILYKKRAENVARKKERDDRMAKERAAKNRERERIYAEKAKLAAIRRAKRKKVYAKIKKVFVNRPSGFNYKNYGFLPRVELKIEGDRTSIATRLAAADINLSDVRCDGNCTTVILRKKDMRKAVAILDEMCYTYQINATYGTGRRLSFLAARLGLIVGLGISAVGMNIVYGYVWRVDISGTDKLSNAAVLATLDGSGVSAGKKKSAGLTERAKVALCEMDGVADASCEIIGTTLYVHVLESNDYVVRGTYGEYQSAYDATVTRISVRMGTATVERGDVVKVGQTLATGDVYSTAGELLSKGECDAEVYGNVAIAYSASISATGVEYRRTGKSATVSVVRLFGLNIGKATSPYASYDMVSHTSHYDVLLPIYVTSYTYYETAPTEYTRDVEQAASEYAQSVADSLEFVGEFDSSYTVTEGAAGLYTIHLFLSGEALISRGVPRGE